MSIRALTLTLAPLALAAPAASADGFREAEVREALATAGFASIADRVAAVSLPH